MKTFYRRHLPHWQPEGQTFFVTFRLRGSLPSSVIELLKIKKARLEQEKAARSESYFFKWLDDALIEEFRKKPSSCWLGNPEIASLVQDAIKTRDGKQYELHRYVIMPNHVHLLIKPLPIVGRVANPSYWELSEIMRGLKRYTAREANRLLGRRGRFWQDECFDRCVRDKREYNRIVRYIDMNPVKAELCAQPCDWLWSSAADEATK